ncbi:hypothetical protein DFH09DRAFT_1069517 [Mycena vulgaris]|nr:hypothetical protein DFH09DRAFT_1069517 [Mycena vulgaris]
MDPGTAPFAECRPGARLSRAAWWSRQTRRAQYLGAENVAAHSTCSAVRRSPLSCPGVSAPNPAPLHLPVTRMDAAMRQAVPTPPIHREFGAACAMLGIAPIVGTRASRRTLYLRTP